MATLPLMAGLPDMQPAPQIDPQPMQQPMAQPGQMPPDIQPQSLPVVHTDDPEMDTLDQSLTMLSPVLDNRAIDSMLDDAERQLATGPLNIPQLSQKAAKHSFALGIQDLSKLLSQGQHSDEYFTKTSQNVLTESADVYASLYKFMTAKTPQKQQQSLSDFRQAVQSLPQVSTRITRLSTRSQQGHFIQDMQASNDGLITQMIGDAVSHVDNGAVAMEYLITGRIPTGMPEPMVIRQAEQLWRAVSSLIGDSINQQLEALIQQSLASILRSESLAQAITPDGAFDALQLQHGVMSQGDAITRKLAAIQQVTNAVFQPARSAKIDQPQQHPINKHSINHYTKG